MNNDVVIVGFGYVGRAYHKMFPNAKAYDPFVKPEDFPEVEFINKEQVNQCKLAIVCVPTPIAKDGWNCDISIVEEIFTWIKTPLVLLKSTVKPGTTERLQKSYEGGICMSPEYVGSSGSYFVPYWKYPHQTDPRFHDFMIIGGEPKYTEEIVNIFIQVAGPHVKFYQVTAKEAEVIKYVENVWGAVKVSFFNDLYNICEAFDVNFNKVREGHLLDPRTEAMHTAVFKNKRGFAGHCYPKDLRAFIKSAEEAGYESKLLKEVLDTNNRIRKENNLDEV